MKSTPIQYQPSELSFQYQMNPVYSECIGQSALSAMLKTPHSIFKYTGALTLIQRQTESRLYPGFRLGALRS